MSEAWKSFMHFSGIEAKAEILPMDALHMTMAFRAKPSIKIWLKTHAGAKKLTSTQFGGHPARPEYCWSYVDAWLKAYAPHREGYNLDELDIYEIPEYPFLLNIKDTDYWVAVAPMNLVKLKSTESQQRRPDE